MKKYIVLSLLFIAGTSISCLLRGFISHKFHTDDTHKTINFDTIDKKLADIQEAIWQELKKYRIDKNNVEKEANLQASNIPVKPFCSLSKETQKFVAGIIDEVGLTHKNIQLVKTTLPEIAMLDDHQMIINETLFNRLSKPAREFIIAHECAHAFYHDTFVKNILAQKCGSIPLLAEKNPQHPACKYSRFTEWRADIWACEKHPRFIQGYETFWQEIADYVKSNVVDTAKTHPLRADRLSVAQGLNNTTHMNINYLVV